MTLLYPAFLTACVLTAACEVGSVAPFVPDSAAQFDPRLLGAWQDPLGKESAVITTRGPTGYSLVYTDEDGKKGRFDATLGRLGNLQILDVVPASPDLPTADLYNALLLPLHGAVFIDSIGAELHFRLLDSDSLDAYVERNPRAIAHIGRNAHVTSGSFLVLTADTPVLLKFFTAFVRRPGALGDVNRWVRHQP